MLPGTSSLMSAREVLVQSGIPADERIAGAWPHFWNAMLHQDRWPIVLRDRAQEFVNVMLIHGNVADTVAGMLDSDLQAMVNDLRRFIDDFRAHDLAFEHATIGVAPLNDRPVHSKPHSLLSGGLAFLGSWLPFRRVRA